MLPEVPYINDIPNNIMPDERAASNMNLAPASIDFSSLRLKATKAANGIAASDFLNADQPVSAPRCLSSSKTVRIEKIVCETIARRFLEIVLVSSTRPP